MANDLGTPLTTGGRNSRKMLAWGLAAVLLTLLMCLTTARFLADTTYYADSIVTRLSGGSYEFIEFGHLVWRPLGLVAYRAVSVFTPAASPDLRKIRIIEVLIGLNWLAFGASAWGFYRLVRAWGVAATASVGGTAAFCVSFGVLNYAHAGSSYIPALACLIWTVVLLSEGSGGVGRSVAAGVVLGASVVFWMPFVLVVPMALAVPWLRPSPLSRRAAWTSVVVTTLALGLTVGLSYLVAILALGLRDLHEVRAWVRSASHGIVGIGGVTRAAFGMPRSFIDMGSDGVGFKRFLLKDVYAPTSFSDLIRQSLAKMGLFYLVLAATLWTLPRSPQGRRWLALLGLAGVPALTFAIFWQGGDVERYLPLYPAFFGAWAFLLSDGGRSTVTKRLIFTFLLVMAASNVLALWDRRLEDRLDTIASRGGPMFATLKPDDLVVVVTPRDELYQYQAQMERRQGRSFRLTMAVAVGFEETPRWRQIFASRVRAAWERGGQVWCSARVLKANPDPSWGWVEGEDKHIRWEEIPAFFSKLGRGETLGGLDGFFLLPRTPENEALLDLGASALPSHAAPTGGTEPTK